MQVLFFPPYPSKRKGVISCLLKALETGTGRSYCSRQEPEILPTPSRDRTPKSDLEANKSATSGEEARETTQETPLRAQISKAPCFYAQI